MTLVTDDIQFCTAQTEEDLRQILTLQKRNLKSEISAQIKKEQGFLTVSHSMEELLVMMQSTPQIIAKHKGEVIAFALAMLPELGKLVSDLKPMFEILDSLSWDRRPLPETNYYVMGQICVDAGFRGAGVFDQLYQEHRKLYAGLYDLCITEISAANFRSQRAHERVGFKTIHVHRDHVDEWNVVGWKF
ncbi:GNAT family N-acetyltransferase [Dyadobacter sp. 32]|uniref:GNAT family N-acetyltransferase n=1 Tax=Dyadobacter sp. 32 TaxID=538966 RepID=UPI0011EE1335